jgi:hypothetical protein
MASGGTAGNALPSSELNGPEAPMEYEIVPHELTAAERDELLRRAQALARILLTVDRPDVRDADGIRHGVMPAAIDWEQYHFDRPLWRRAYAAGMDDMLAWVRGLILFSTPASGVDMDQLEQEYRNGMGSSEVSAPTLSDPTAHQ